MHITSLQLCTLFQLKCPKQRNENNNMFEINFGSGTYTRDWRLCGLRTFEGGKYLIKSQHV